MTVIAALDSTSDTGRGGAGGSRVALPLRRARAVAVGARPSTSVIVRNESQRCPGGDSSFHWQATFWAVRLPGRPGIASTQTVASRGVSSRSTEVRLTTSPG